MRFLDELKNDIRYALRQMARTPVLTAVSIGVLAIGIGANSAVISFADTLMRPRAPGVENKDRLMAVEVASFSHGRLAPYGLDFAEMLELGERQRVFAEVGAVWRQRILAGAYASRDAQWVGFASARYFAAMQPRMTLGRAFTAPDDHAAQPERIAVVSYGYWKSKLGGDTAVLGTNVYINSVPMPIVGVLPEGYSASAGVRTAPDVWVPMASRSLLFPSDSAFNQMPARSFMQTVALLKPDVAPEVAATTITSLPPSDAGERQEYIRDARMQARPLYTPSDRDAKVIGQVAASLTGLSALFLAIACANVSILLLGRAVGRRREIAVRLSLGAPRKRIVRQLVTESSVLAVIGSAAGIALIRPLSAILENVGWHFPLQVNWRVAALSVGVAILTGILFGLAPALHATRASVSDAMKQGSSGDRGRTRMQRSFVIAEVAMSMALVCSAALLLRAARNEVNADPGFDVSRSVLVSQISFELPQYTAAQADQVMRAISERLAGIPAIESFGFSNEVPFARRGGWARVVFDKPLDPRRGLASAPVTLIDGEYLDAMGIVLETGRPFGDDDALGTLPVALVSRDLATQLWPGQNPLGQRVTFRSRRGQTRIDSRTAAVESNSYVVIGVVQGSGPVGARGNNTELILSRKQLPLLSDMNLVLRVRDVSPALTRTIASAVQTAAPNLLFAGFKSTQQYADEDPGDAEALGVGAALAGSVALVLACVGLFAVVAFAVAQRSREIGIRLALGATQRTVVDQFFREGLRLASFGMVIGIPISLAIMRIIEANDDSVKVLGVLPVTVVVATLVAVAMAAAWIPARRAARVDPLVALRSE